MIQDKYTDEQILIAIRLSIPEGLTAEEAKQAVMMDTKDWSDKQKRLLLPKLEAMEGKEER